ncbi:MAG TPA: hypothetical protein PKO15_10115 [Fibrobacteria bacterium]|nr:hypothetical protein [Fibrobacteria bacterium]
MNTPGLRIAAGILCLAFVSCDQTVLSSQPQAQENAKDSTVRVANPPTSVVGDGLKTLEVGGAPIEGRLRYDSIECFRIYVEKGKAYFIVLESEAKYTSGSVHETSLPYPENLLDRDSATQLLAFSPNETKAHYRGRRTGPAVLRVRSEFLEDTARFRVSLILDTSGNDAYESDDVPGHPSQIEPDGSVQARFLSFDDHDWIQFPMVSGKSYRIEVKGNILREVFPFYLHQGGVFGDSVLNSDNVTDREMSSCYFTSGRTGMALIEISNSFRWSDTGSYRVSVQVDSTDQDPYEPDGAGGRETSIRVGDEIQSHVLRLRDYDLLKFHGEKDMDYTVSVNFQGNGSALKVTVLNISDTTWHSSVPGPDGIWTPYVEHSEVLISEQGSLSFKAKRTGEFIIQIRGDDPLARGPYQVHVDRSP